MMFDYAGWVRRAQSFTSELDAHRLGEWEFESEIAPPMDEQSIINLERTLSRDLPGPLRGFFKQGSRCLECRYVWTPAGASVNPMHDLFPSQGGYIYGGARLCDALDLPEMLKECEMSAESFQKSPEQEAFWLNALPFAWIRNGDTLALDMRHSLPPVVYLAHDDDSRVIAPSFDAFLNTWERLCYIGPEIWLLDEFLDSETGLMNADTDKARQLRDLFSVGAS